MGLAPVAVSGLPPHLVCELALEPRHSDLARGRCLGDDSDGLIDRQGSIGAHRAMLPVLLIERYQSVRLLTCMTVA